MTPEQFVYWLQGFVEISGKKELSPEQMIIVQDHLDLVLTKVTPERRPEQKRCDKTLSPELENLLKEAAEELKKPPSQRRKPVFKRNANEPRPQLRCSGSMDNQTYC